LATATFQLLDATREALLAADGGWEEAPDGWRLVELSAVADIRSGITKGRKVAGSLVETPFIRAANVQDGFLDLSELKTLPVSDVERERFGLRAADVLMTEGGNAEHVGRGWVWEGQAEPAVCQNHVFRVRVDTELVSPRFLAYAIGASPARAYCLDSAKKTTNLASINKSQVSAMRVPLPPLGEQQDITRRLDPLRCKAVRELRLAQGLTSFRRTLVDDLITGIRNIPDG
jgi:type I restriction enzyme S subunit